MSTKQILLVSQVDITKITYGPPKVLDNGGRIIPVFHKNSPLIIQIPILKSPYGISRWESDKGGATKCNLDLSFGDYQQNTDLGQFMNIMKSMDQKLIEDGLTNSMTWFNKKIKTIDILEALYTPIVKHYKDKETQEISDKYPPTFKMQLPYKDGKYTCEVYDKEKNRVELTGLDLKGSKVVAIVQCTGIWVAGGKFGCTWKAMQMKIEQNKSKISGYAFIEDSDDDE